MNIANPFKRKRGELANPTPAQWDQWDTEVKSRRLEYSQQPLNRYKVMETGEIFLAHYILAGEGMVQFIVYTEDGQETIATMTPFGTIVLQKEVENV